MVRYKGCGTADPSGALRHLPLRRGGFEMRIATASDFGHWLRNDTFTRGAGVFGGELREE